MANSTSGAWQSFASNSTLNSTVDGQYTQAAGDRVALIGSHFKNPLFVAPICINAICAAVFLAFTIHECVVRDKENRKAFVVIFSLLSGMTLSFLRSFVDGMLHEYALEVPSAFLILPALKSIIDDLSEIVLIGVIYRIIKNRNRWLTSNEIGYKWWQTAHTGTTTLLTILAVADTALSIDAQVLLFNNDIDSSELIAAAARYKDIHLAYVTVYLATTIEILFCTIFLKIQARRQDRPNKIITYLITLVSPPLVLRSASALAVTTRCTYQAHSESRGLAVAATALYGLPSVVTFTGLVLIKYSKGWFADPGSSTAGHGHGAPVQVISSPNMGYAGGGGAFWPPPQQPRVHVGEEPGRKTPSVAAAQGGPAYI